jgi:hypothetical protein
MWEPEIRKTVVPGPPVQKNSVRPPSQQKKFECSNPSDSEWKLKIGGKWSRLARSKTLSQKSRAKWVVGMTQVVAHLPPKHKALSSNPSTTK